MEAFLDTLLNNIFGGMGIGLVIFNGILGLALVLTGVFMNKKTASKSKKTVGMVLICIGVLAVIFAILRL